MAVEFTGWVARHTGMPTMRLTTTAGVRAEVRAKAGAQEWVAWAQIGTGSPAIFSDPLAPVGQETTYTLGSRSVRLTRRPLGGHVITDEHGRLVVHMRVTGDDSVSHATGITSMATTMGAADRWPLVTPPEEYRLECLTSGEDTTTLRSLVRAHGRVIVLHDPATCQVPDCDIPPVRRCVVTSASEARTGRVDQAVRAWQITLSDRSRDEWRLPPDHGGAPGAVPAVPGAPAVTWGDWQKIDGAWKSRTYDELAQIVAGRPA